MCLVLLLKDNEQSPVFVKFDNVITTCPLPATYHGLQHGFSYNKERQISFLNTLIRKNLILYTHSNVF